MTLFLRRLLVYILLTSITALLTLKLIGWGYQKKIDWTLPSGIDIVILGNSHAELGIDDRFLFKTINLSRSAHSFFENYHKLKYLTANNKIQRVILEVNHTDLTKHAEDLFILSDPVLKGEFGNYLGMSSMADLIELSSYSSFKSVTLSHFNSLDQALIELCFKKKNYSSFGGYLPFKRNLNLDSLYTEVKKDISFDRSQLANYNLILLDKIVEHCIKNQLELIFITSPVHSYYLELYDEIKLDSILSIRYPQIMHLNFSRYSVVENGYADLGHLNSIGAADFTAMLKTKKVIE